MHTYDRRTDRSPSMPDLAYISGINSVSIDKGPHGDIVCTQMN
ncbi:MAG: hypothetical protein OJF62_000460 [Pseudolabrys sp.]|nr:hypothetical protein [Pseudolabrys sp.]